MTGKRSRFSLLLTLIAVVTVVLGATFATPTPTTAQGTRPVSSHPTAKGGNGKGGVAPAGMVLLYNQTGTQDFDVTSQDFEAAFDAFDNQAADDFVVPAGDTWLVDSVFANGAYSATPSGQTWDVFFYSDSGGVPGALVGSAVGATATTDVAGDVTIPVAPAVSLPAGTYWVSVQINMAFTPGGQWFWGELNGITNNDFAWQNPGGGFGANCPTWNRNCAFLQAQDDLIFQIYGISGGPTPTPTATSTPSATPAPTLQTYCSTFTPVSVVDNVPTTFVTGTLNIPAAATILDANVRISMTHTWIGDLIFRLSNGTTSTIIVDRPGFTGTGAGCPANNIDDSFVDDEGPDGTWESSCVNVSGQTPAYPAGSRLIGGGTVTTGNPTLMTAYDGASTAGTWSLGVSDNAGGDTGTLNQFCLEVLVSGGGATATPTQTPTPSATATCSVGGGSWTAASSMLSGMVRYGFAQTATDFYVVSGVDSAFNIVTTVQRYNTVTGLWSPLAPIPFGRELPGTAIWNGNLYVAGGTDTTGIPTTSFQIYNIASNSWSAGPALPTATWGAAVGAWNGRVYVAGGSTDGVNPINTMQVYDIATNSWSSGTLLPTAALNSGYTQVGQYLYVVGSYGATPLNGVTGLNGATLADSTAAQRRALAPDANGTATQRLDMTTVGGAWSSGPTFTPQRADFALASDGSTLYAIGGDANGGGFFDPTVLVDELSLGGWPAGTWTASTNPLPTARQANQSGFFGNGAIWSTGGFNGAAILSEHLYRNVGGCTTATPTATNTPTPTNTNSPTPTNTFTPTPTNTNSPTPTHTFTPTPTNTNSPTPTNTFTPTPTNTNTPVPPTNTATATNTNTPVPPTNTATATNTNTPVPPTNTATATNTNTPVPPTNTPTRTNTATATNTPVPPTNTATATNTPVPPTNTATATPGGGGNRFCSTVPIVIPDANPTGATGTINVPSSATISDLNVIITGTHTWVGDIVLNISNGTTNVTFYDQPGVPASTFGCSGDNLPGVIGDDEGVNGSFENSCQNATPAYTPGGSYTNNNALSAFDGATTNATWTLTASDLAAGDTGSISSWCVEFATGAGPTATATPTTGATTTATATATTGTTPTATATATTGATPTATPTVPAQVPDINVNPSSFNETHSSPPQVTTDTMNIGNTGNATLTWTITEDDSRPFANPNPAQPRDPNAAVARQGAAGGSTTSKLELGPIVGDGSFETGTPNASWEEFSTNFGTPLCDAVCGLGGGTGPRTGAWWAWFGGTTSAETGIITQSVTIPSGSAELTFWLEIPATATGTNGFLSVRMDGTEVFRAEETTTGYGTYAEVSVDVSAYADGSAHELVFFSITDAGAAVTNFFVDDVAITAQAGGQCTAPTDIPWLTVVPLNGSTAGGGSTPVTLTYNSASLAYGTYTSTLCIASNDPDKVLVTVPITFNVTNATAIDLSSFTTPMSGIKPADLTAAGLLLLAGAVLVLRRK